MIINMSKNFKMPYESKQKNEGEEEEEIKSYEHLSAQHARERKTMNYLKEDKKVNFTPDSLISTC